LERERRQSGARALSAQEQERERISRGLHDEVGQTMTGVLFQLKQLGRDATPEQRRALAEAQQTVKTSLEEVRRIAQELRPELLEHLGLARALASLARGFGQQTGIPIRTELAGTLPPLDREVEVVVYRVAQEALTNAARHSGASRIVLVLESDADSVVLRVIDDGHGFQGRPEEGGGLRGIRERALIVGGAAAIKPGPDGGVEVRLQVPVAATT
ncbi:MAG: sensor histidine kinase, partial [Gaiellaceae bacterium]